VLWTEVQSGPNAGWYITHSSTNAEDCFEAAAKLRPTDRSVAKDTGVLTTRLCLPDTVDPRGRKK